MLTAMTFLSGFGFAFIWSTMSLIGLLTRREQAEASTLHSVLAFFLGGWKETQSGVETNIVDEREWGLGERTQS
jgi:hypothetical protein